MAYTKFRSAAEIRAFLRSRGILKVQIRISHNPFGGDDRFTVKRTDLPEGVAVATSSNSQGTGFYSNDGGKTASMLAELGRILQDTNAFPIT